MFTRIGASDRILEGKSTFFVELEETKAIVEEASSNSLVIMDELGRGTSTFDGYSIALSVLRFLTAKTLCRTLFTTHYHMIVDDVKPLVSEEKVSLFHMASQFDKASQELKFLYKFERGVATQSFGITVAKMAGVPSCVLEKAAERAARFSSNLRGLRSV